MSLTAGTRLGPYEILAAGTTRSPFQVVALVGVGMEIPAVSPCNKDELV